LPRNSSGARKLAEIIDADHELVIERCNFELLGTKAWTARDELANATSTPSTPDRTKITDSHRRYPCHGKLIACITAKQSVLFAC